jgi:hypothetical protein
MTYLIPKLVTTLYKWNRSKQIYPSNYRDWFRAKTTLLLLFPVALKELTNALLDFLPECLIMLIFMYDTYDLSNLHARWIPISWYPGFSEEELNPHLKEGYYVNFLRKTYRTQDSVPPVKIRVRKRTPKKKICVKEARMGAPRGKNTSWSQIRFLHQEIKRIQKCIKKNKKPEDIRQIERMQEQIRHYQQKQQEEQEKNCIIL